MSRNECPKPPNAEEPPALPLSEEVRPRTLWIEPLEERMAPGVIWGS